MASIGQDSQTFLQKRRQSRLNSYRNSPEDITAHFSDEGQIQADYHKRFAFELIQNADDAMQDVDTKKVRFELNDGALLVANTGRPIDEEDVKALCTMSYTTKGAEGEKRASIGHKGRGFSSVLEITDKPQIFSTGISFEFDGERSREEIEGLVEDLDDTSMESIDGVPLMRLPFSPQGTPDRVEELLESGYNTVFRFDLKSDKVEQDVVDTVSDLDRNTVLFLQELKRLETSIEDGREAAWEIDRENKSIESSRTSLEFVTVRRIGEDGETGEDDTFALFSRDEVEIGDHTGGIDENTWGDVNYTQIGLALRVEHEEDGVHLKKLEERPFAHVFLPTEERCPVPVLINGAFHTAISRTNINVTADEDNYNGFLLQQMADLLATDVREYADGTATTVEEFIECLDFTQLSEDQTQARDRLEGRLVEALKEKFAEVEFIPRLEKLATGEILSDPGVKPLNEVVIPYYSEDKPEVAEAVARIYGNTELDLESLDIEGWFPKTSLLTPRRAAILEGLGAPVLDPEDVPTLLGTVSDESTPLILPEEDNELAVDPILQVLVWIWKSISSQDEVVEEFKDAANSSDVFPAGKPEGQVVKHIRREDGTQFFLPPRNELPDIELSGIRFLTPPVYRPEKRVKPARQSELVEDIRPALEAIWDVNEFDFEEVVQAAVFPKLASPRQPDADDSELRNKQVLELVHRLAEQSVDEDNPLPFVERDGSLHRLCLLPVPTRDGGWKPAYQVYFGRSWQPEEPEERRIEPLLGKTGVDADYLAQPESLPGDTEFEADEDGESEFDDWKRFFRWLGVAQHIRLKPFFDPREQRNFTATLGINRPDGSSILSVLPDDDWSEYQSHLRNKLENSTMQRGEYDSIYQIQGIEFFNQYLRSAQEDSEVAEMFFNHLVSWWQDELRDYRTPVLATHDVRSFGRRNKSCPKEREKRRTGMNLWLWQLKRATWCPSNQGRVKPEELWMPTESVTKRFRIHDTTLLPVLSEDVLEHASKARDLVHDLGIRSDPSQGSFKPDDAAVVAETVARMFQDTDDEVISDSLRQIKPVYRYLSELLPGLDSQGRIADNSWDEAREQLQNIRVLCRNDDTSFSFRTAKDAYFVRSPDVLDRIPIQGVPLFVLQEDEAARFGTYFGLHDLENEAEPTPTYHGDLDDETGELRDDLQDLAPFILCRLEAERASQDLIDQDINGMRTFLDTLQVNNQIEVVYRFDQGKEETEITAYPDYFLDSRDRSQGERPLPFVKHSWDEKEQNRFVARALCEYLGVSQFEGIITLLDADSDERRLQFLKLAGAPSTMSEVEGKKRELTGEELPGGTPVEHEFENDRTRGEGFQNSDRDDTVEEELTRRKNREQQTHPVYEPSELAIEGDTVTIQTEPEEGAGDSDSDSGSSGNNTGSGSGVSASYRTKVDKLGMEVTLQHEHNRLRDEYGCESPEDYVYDIHDEEEYLKTKEPGEAGKPVLETLVEKGLPELFPGFDILVVNPETGEADRLIELKSSGHDTRTPPITWNEWKTASEPGVQDLFYLYIVGNLRKDVSSEPYLKEIPNPFQLLNSETQKQREVRKEVKVDVTSFKKQAEIKQTFLNVAEEYSE